jgi:phosphoglucosamine mutase
VNLKVTDKPDWETLPEVQRLVDNARSTLGDSGRVLLRYSGTEPKARLLIEGQDRPQIQALADGIADAIRARIGA